MWLYKLFEPKSHIHSLDQEFIGSDIQFAQETCRMKTFGKGRKCTNGHQNFN